MSGTFPPVKYPDFKPAFPGCKEFCSVGTLRANIGGGAGSDV
jgi:hypothetical protein